MNVSSSSEKAHIEVVNPVASVMPAKAVMPPQRLDSINGKKIALWWNSKSRGDVALSTVAEMLKKRYPDVQFVRFSQQYDHGRHFPEYYDQLKQSGCDAVIATTGD